MSMPQIKPTKTLDVLGKLRLRPENRSGFYQDSKQQDSFHIKKPNWDSAGDRIELLALQNNQEHKEMMQLQYEMLENARRQGVIHSNRIEQLRRLQMELKQRFIEANGFLKDCDDKRKSAEAKVLAEKVVHAMLKDGIQKNREGIEELLKFREVLKNTVQDFEPYERVIHEVVEKTGVFSSVKDCIERCDALMITQVDISEMKREKLLVIEEMRANMNKLTSEAALTVLGLINELAELERAYSLAFSDVLKWEKVLVDIKLCIVEANCDRRIITNGIDEMYRDLCKRRDLYPIYQRSDICRQMNFIKNEVKILNEVLKLCNRPT